ncbi:lysylphosphatidylglycerol synthase transmembrane domain-containing protein [Spirochaeta dissipatitropha]
MLRLLKVPGFFLIAVLLYRAIGQADLSEFSSTLRQLRPGSVGILILLQMTSLLLAACLWARIISSLLPGKFRGIRHLFEIFRINSAASVMESITPSSKLGGEGVKILLLQRYTGNNAAGIAGLVAIHKLIILLPLMLIALTVILSGFLLGNPNQMLVELIPVESALLIIGLVLLFGILLVFLAVFLQRRLPMLEDKLHTLIILSLLMWLLYPLKYYLVAVAYGIDIQFSSLASATFIAYFAGLLPLTPGGLGTFELSMAHVLAMNGLSLSEGLLIAGTGRLITFWFPLLISILFAASYLLPAKKRQLCVSSATVYQKAEYL